MIGFDLDGVLVADVTWTPEIVPFRNLGMNALFVPQGDYVIITGRPKAQVDTQQWVDRELSSNPPKEVYMGNDDWEKSNDYKIHILKLNPDIEVFVESDEAVVEVLRNVFPERRIIHFKTLVQRALARQ
jgi:hypothetical protein